MTKADFLTLLGEAYDFPDYYSHNLDSADEILYDLCEEEERERLDLEKFLKALLTDTSPEDRVAITYLIRKYLTIDPNTAESFEETAHLTPFPPTNKHPTPPSPQTPD